MGIIPRWFDLDVLSQHVETGFFDEVNLPKHRFITGGCVEPIRPVALVKRAVQEQGLVVQAESEVAVRVAIQTVFAHAEVALDAVNDLSVRL